MNNEIRITFERDGQAPDIRVVEVNGFGPSSWSPRVLVGNFHQAALELVKPLVRVDEVTELAAGVHEFVLSLPGGRITLLIPNLQPESIARAVADINGSEPPLTMDPAARVLLERAGQPIS